MRWMTWQVTSARPYQKAQIDAAKEAGVGKIILVSSMVGWCRLSQ